FCRNKAILPTGYSRSQCRILFDERVHLVLQDDGVRFCPELGFPRVKVRAVWVPEGCPEFRRALLEKLDDMLYLRWHRQFRMVGSKQENVSGNLRRPRRRAFYTVVSEEEDNCVEGDQPKRDNRPPARRHVFMADWDEHANSPASERWPHPETPPSLIANQVQTIITEVTSQAIS